MKDAFLLNEELLKEDNLLKAGTYVANILKIATAQSTIYNKEQFVFVYAVKVEGGIKFFVDFYTKSLHKDSKLNYILQQLFNNKLLQKIKEGFNIKNLEGEFVAIRLKEREIQVAYFPFIKKKLYIEAIRFLTEEEKKKHKFNTKDIVIPDGIKKLWGEVNEVKEDKKNDDDDDNNNDNDNDTNIDLSKFL